MKIEANLNSYNQLIAQLDKQWDRTWDKAVSSEGRERLMANIDALYSSIEHQARQIAGLVSKLPK